MSTLEVPGARIQLERMKVMGQQDIVVTGGGGIEVASEKQETLLEGITGQTRVTEVAR